MNTKLHAVTDANGRPLSFFMTAGQVSDYIGAAALLDELPKAQWLLGDRGYDADWFRDALQKKGIKPCRETGSCKQMTDLAARRAWKNRPDGPRGRRGHGRPGRVGTGLLFEIGELFWTATSVPTQAGRLCSLPVDREAGS